MLRSRYFILLICTLLVGCSEFQQAVKDAQKDIPPPPKDNYIVLLDLSDRVLANNQQQVAKDLTVINAIYALFKSRLDEKDPTHLYYRATDKIKLLVAPQQSTPVAVFDMVGSLRAELATETPEKKATQVEETQKRLTTVLPEIYKQAVISNRSKDYSGADIWKYFDEDLEDDLDTAAQNTLFIITDGYLDFENGTERPTQKNRYTSCAQVINALKGFTDWNVKFEEGDYGLIPVNKQFKKLKVVLLEINPKPEWNGEYNLLTRTWSKWFTEMGITNYRFVKDDNINEVKESLEKFMKTTIAQKIAPVSWTPVTTDDDTETVPAMPTAITVPAGNANKNSAVIRPLVQSRKPVINTTTDESEEAMAATISKKKEAVPVKPVAAPKKEDDILNDAAPKKGFNTGIKKNKKGG
jgi:hypothetical protein